MVKLLDYRAHVLLLKNNTASYLKILLKIKKTTSNKVWAIRLNSCCREICFSVILRSAYPSSFWFGNLMPSLVTGFSMSFPPLVSTY